MVYGECNLCRDDGKPVAWETLETPAQEMEAILFVSCWRKCLPLLHSPDPESVAWWKMLQHKECSFLQLAVDSCFVTP